MARLAWAALQWLLTAAFVFSAALQWNDPDPIPWMAIYGAAAVVSAWAALRPAGYPWWLPAALALVSLIWNLTLLPQVMGKVRFSELFEAWEMKSPRIEVAREAGGLLIVTVWMAATALVRLAFRG